MKRIWLFFFCGIAGLLFLMCSACNQKTDTPPDDPQARYEMYFLGTPTPTSSVVIIYSNNAGPGGLSTSIPLITVTITPTPSPGNPSPAPIVTTIPDPNPPVAYKISMPLPNQTIGFNFGSVTEGTPTPTPSPTGNYADWLAQQVMADPQSAVRILRDAQGGYKFRGILASPNDIFLNSVGLIGGVYTLGKLTIAGQSRITEDSLYIHDAKVYNSALNIGLLEQATNITGVLNMSALPYKVQITQYRELGVPQNKQDYTQPNFFGTIAPNLDQNFMDNLER